MLDTYSYLGLFLFSFLSATILPGGAEAVFYYLEINHYDKWSVIGVATLGNTLGAITSYFLGFYGSRFAFDQLKKLGKKRKKLVDYAINKYGLWSALFTWLPFIGDLIAIFLGIYKKDPMKVTMLMAIGKLLRFVVLWELIKQGASF